MFCTSVSELKNTADTGICLLRYASGIVENIKGAFTNQSFNKDCHSGILSSCNKFNYSASKCTTLRQECNRLVCRISQKYTTVRVIPITDPCSHPPDEECSSSCCCNNSSFLPQVFVSQDSDSCSDESSETNSRISNDTGSLYTPEDDDIEQDESVHSSDENESVEECYSDYNDTPIQGSLEDEGDIEPVDNLICPGDVVEYCLIKSDTSIMKSSIVTIDDCSDKAKYIVLENGVILHAKTHAVRKVEMYCTASQILIPNPLGVWLTVDKCILEVGSLLKGFDDNDDNCDSGDNEEDQPR